MDESKNSSNGGDLVGLFKDPEFAKLDDKEKVRVLLQVEPDLAKCKEHEWNYIIGEVAARADEELTAARRAQMQQQRPTTPEEPEQGEESYVARVAKAALNVASAFGVTEYDPSAAAVERDKQIAEDFIGSATGRAASFVLAYPLELAKNIPQAQVNLGQCSFGSGDNT